MTMSKNEEVKYNKSNLYTEITYDSKKRFCSYWHQIQEVILTNPRQILEIGIGNGFVSKYLKERQFQIVTIDVDEKLKPDIAGSVLGIPFVDESFDAVVCYEVLEHLPFQNFADALREINRVTRAHAVISLPDISGFYIVYLDLPIIGEIKKLITRPTLKLPPNKFDGYHCWEIGKATYPLKTIKSVIKNAGFDIRRTFRVFECPYHRFFILEKVVRIL